MEKVIIALRAVDTDDSWVGQMTGPISESLLELGLPGVTLNVRDAPVRDAVMTLTTLDPPVQGFVTLWSQQHYGDEVRAALEARDRSALPTLAPPHGLTLWEVTY